MRRQIGRKEAEHLFFQSRIALENDGVVRPCEQRLGADVASQRLNVIAQPQGIAHGQRIRVARHRYDIFQTEYARLFGNAPPQFAHRQPALLRARLRIQPFVSTSRLLWLQGDAAHAAPVQRMTDHLADFVFIDAAPNGHHQRC